MSRRPKGRNTRAKKRKKAGKESLPNAAVKQSWRLSKWLVLRLLIVYLSANFALNLILNITQPLKPLRLLTLSRVDQRVEAAGMLLRHYLPSHRCAIDYDQAAIEKTAHRVAQEVGVETALLLSIVKAESAFRPHVVSQVGAIGVAQLMPATAQWLKVSDPFEVEENLMGSATYLKRLHKQFDGDLKLVAAAYNAGPGAVRRYKGVPPYGETRHYVKKVSANLVDYRKKYPGKSTSSPSAK